MPEPKTIRGTSSQIFLLSAFAGITLGMLGFHALAQEHIQSEHRPFEPVIDGSVRPQDTLDNVAIRVLMQSLRASVKEGPGLGQLYSRVQRAELSNVDIQILVRGLGEFDSRAKNQEARIQAERPASEAADEEAVARLLSDF